MKSIQIKIATLLLGTATLLLVGCDKHDHSTHDHGGGNAAAPSSSHSNAYPLQNCVVSGEALDSMGGPYVISHQATTVKLCCKSCLDDFNENPSFYLAKITNASG